MLTNEEGPQVYLTTDEIPNGILQLRFIHLHQDPN